MHEYINKLTEHRNSTENFLKSLKYIDNGFIIGEFFKELDNDGIDYLIIKGFDYLEKDNLFSEFRGVYFVTDGENEIYTDDDRITISREDKFYVLSLNI